MITGHYTHPSPMAYKYQEVRTLRSRLCSSTIGYNSAQRLHSKLKALVTDLIVKVSLGGTTLVSPKLKQSFIFEIEDFCKLLRYMLSHDNSYH